MRKSLQRKHSRRKIGEEGDNKRKLTPKELAKTLEEEFVFVPTDAEDNLRNAGIYYITGEIDGDSLLSYHQDILVKHFAPVWRHDIQLVVNSIGGEVSEGWMLIDLLDYIRMDVRTIGMGEICSLGTMLVAAGTPGKRSVSANCSLMIHGFSMGMSGTRQKLVDTMGFVEREHEREIEFWVRQSNLCREGVEKLFLDGRDHYFTPHEALKLGIVDEVSEPQKDRDKPQEEEVELPVVDPAPKPKRKRVPRSK